MKLIFLFVLGLLINVFKSEEYVLKGQLTKYNVVTLKSNYRLTYYFAYLDTRDFPDEDEIGLKVTVYDGDLVRTNMWYGGYEDISSPRTLNSSKSYYSSTYTSSGLTYYDEITYYYKIPKPSKKYLYVSLPFFDGYSYSYAELTVDVISNKIGVIIAIVIAVVVFIVATIIIVVYCVRKYRRRSLINPDLGYSPQINTYANQPPVASPIYPQAAPYSPPIAPAYQSPNYY